MNAKKRDVSDIVLPPPPPKEVVVYVTWYNHHLDEYVCSEYKNADIAILTPTEGVVLFSIKNHLNGVAKQQLIKMVDVGSWTIVSVDKEGTMEP